MYLSAGASTFVASAAAGRFEGIAFDADGNLYVGNDAAFVIEKFSSSGADLGPFVSLPGAGSAYGLAFDRNGNLFAANYSDRTIVGFSPTGASLGIFASGLGNPRDLLIVTTPEPSTGLLVFSLCVFGLIGVWWRRDRRESAALHKDMNGDC